MSSSNPEGRTTGSILKTSLAADTAFAKGENKKNAPIRPRFAREEPREKRGGLNPEAFVQVAREQWVTETSTKPARSAAKKEGGSSS